MYLIQVKIQWIRIWHLGSHLTLGRTAPQLVEGRRSNIAGSVLGSALTPVGAPTLPPVVHCGAVVVHCGQQREKSAILTTTLKLQLRREE